LASLLAFTNTDTPAAALSAGCSFNNWTGPVGYPPVWVDGPFAFDGGDTVTITGSVPFNLSGTFHATGVSSFSHTFPSAATATFNISLVNQGVIQITLQCTPGSPSSGGSTGSSSPAVTFWNFTDGRVNSHDGAETAAVYCEDDGGVTVYAVINSVGHL